MYIDFSKLFHRASKDTSDQGTKRVPKDDKLWPRDWTTTFYKTYEDLPELKLPHTDTEAPLFTYLHKRKSRTSFTKHPLTLGELSDVLLYSCGETGTTLPSGQKRRAQPSAGGRYAIEAYVLVFTSSADMPAGIYHYNVQNHSLVSLWKRDFTDEDIEKFFSYSWVQNASAAIILTGVFRRVKEKYGQRGYRYMLLEAGHIGQNIYLSTDMLGIGCCGLGGTRDEALEKLLDIDGVSESVLYSLALGK